MKAVDLLDALSFGPDITICDMHKGLTSQSFLLEMNRETYILRIPRADNERIVGRRHEAMALGTVRGVNIDVEAIYYNKVGDYKVIRYLSDVRTHKKYEGPCKLERIATLMERFHPL